MNECNEVERRRNRKRVRARSGRSVGGSNDLRPPTKSSIKERSEGARIRICWRLRWRVSTQRGGATVRRAVPYVARCNSHPFERTRPYMMNCRATRCGRGTVRYRACAPPPVALLFHCCPRRPSINVVASVRYRTSRRAGDSPAVDWVPARIYACTVIGRIPRLNRAVVAAASTRDARSSG